MLKDAYTFLPDFQDSSFLYQLYEGALPADLLRAVSLQSLIQVEKELSQEINPVVDRDRLQNLWRFIADTSSVVKFHLQQYERSVTEADKLGVEIKAAEITDRVCTGMNGERLQRGEKPTETQISAAIKIDPSFQEIYRDYLQKKQTCDHVKGFYEHLREIRQLLWTRKETLLDLTESQRRNLD